MTRDKNNPVRVVAAQLLKELLAEGRSLSPLIPKYATQVADADKPFLQALCFGVCRLLPRYEYWLQGKLKKPLKKKDADVESLVYLGIFQLLELRIPDHAAIAETVEAAKALRKTWAASLLNALLRDVQREGLRVEKPLDVFTYAHPSWLVNQLKRAWPNDWQSILEANNTQAPMTLRVNKKQGSKEVYLHQLAVAGVGSRPSTMATDALILERPVDALALPSFAEGAVSVQDESAQLAASLLDLKPKQRVLDACCAPGGKTCHILETEPELEHLIAVDLDGDRLSRVTENLERLKLKAELKTADIAELPDWWDGQAFDRILLDAPCSATGVIRRHPDIKLLRRHSDIQELASLQLALLLKLWSALAENGRLVYATCSILPEENEQVIERFLQDQDNAKHITIDIACGIKRPYGRQLFPNVDGHDGFYYAVLVKTVANK